MAKKELNTQSESSIQQQIVKWYRNTYCLKHHNPRSMIFSIPNESNGSRAMKLIQTGLYPGCADLMVIHLNGRFKLFSRIDETPFFLFFEVKTPTGVQSPKQKHFEDHCTAMAIRYYMVRSLDEFKQVIENL